MALEQRLHDELNAAADTFRPDTEGALVQVVQTNRRRQRVRRGAMALGAAGLVFVAVVGLTQSELTGLHGAPGPTAHSTAPPPGPGPGSDDHAYHRDPIYGEWQTGSLASEGVQSAITSAGVDENVARQELRDTSRWRVQVNFQQGIGGAVAVFDTWDPTDPAATLDIGDEFPYTSLPGHRLRLSPRSTGDSWVFSYRITGDRLQLHLVRASPALAARDAAMVTAWTSAPFILVH